MESQLALCLVPDIRCSRVIVISVLVIGLYREAKVLTYCPCLSSNTEYFNILVTLTRQSETTHKLNDWKMLVLSLKNIGVWFVV